MKLLRNTQKPEMPKNTQKHTSISRNDGNAPFEKRKRYKNRYVVKKHTFCTPKKYSSFEKTQKYKLR